MTSNDDIAQQGIPGSESSEDIREIRETIEHTRAQMSETLNELQERLSPAHIKAQIRDQIRNATIGKVEDMAQRANDRMYEARQSVVETVTANPIPAAMVGIGLAWLLLNRRGNGNAPMYSRDARRSLDYSRGERFDADYAESALPNQWHDHDRYASSDAGAGSTSQGVSGIVGQVRDSARDAAARVKDRVSGAVDQGQERAAQMVDQARQTTGRVVNQAQQAATRVASSAQAQAYQAQQRFNQTLDENPLAIGALALAVGTAIGLALPQTRKENELMGETRDNLLDTARSAVRGASEQVQQVARDPSLGAKQGTQPQSGAQGSSM